MCVDICQSASGQVVRTRVTAMFLAFCACLCSLLHACMSACTRSPALQNSSGKELRMKVVLICPKLCIKKLTAGTSLVPVSLLHSAQRKTVKNSCTAACDCNTPIGPATPFLYCPDMGCRSPCSCKPLGLTIVIKTAGIQNVGFTTACGCRQTKQRSARMARL